MVKFISEICSEYGSSLIEIVESSSSNQDELAAQVGGCDLFVALMDSDVEDHVMAQFNVATICNTKAATPAIYVYNQEPKDGEVASKNRELFTSYLLEEAKRYWCRYSNHDFMRILLALQLEAACPNIFETRLIGTNIYLRNLKVGDMVNSSAVQFSSIYSSVQEYIKETDRSKEGETDPKELYQKAILSRSLRQKGEALLATYHQIYREMATLPSRASASQLRLGYNAISYGNSANALKILNAEELSATVSRLVAKIKAGEELSQYEALELSGAIEAMGLRGQVLMTDILNPNHIDQAIEALQKAVFYAREGKSPIATYAKHLTNYAHFLNKYKDNSDGAKWYEGVVEMLLRSSGDENMVVGKAYIDLANFYISIGNDDKAMWALKGALSIFSKLSPKDPLIGLIYWGFAKIHSRRGEYQEALTCCTTGEELYLMTHSAADITSLKFWFLQINIGNEAFQPNFSEYEFLNKESLLLEYYGQEEPLIEFYLFFSDMYADNKRYKESVEILRKALAISDDKLGELCQTSQTILNRIVIGERYLEDNQAALTDSQELVRRLRNAPDADMDFSAQVLYTMASIKDSLEDFSGAVSDFNNAQVLYSSVYGEDYIKRAECYKQMSDIFFKCGQYGSAIKYYKNALSIVEAKHGENSIEAASYYNSIANSYLREGKGSDALEFLNKTLTLDSGAELEPDIRNVVVSAYIGIGEAHSIANDYGAAIDTYKLLIDRFGDCFSIIYSDVYLRFATALKETGDDQGAYDNYFKALDIKVAMYGDETKYTGPIYIEIARLYEKYKKYEDALTHYHKGIRAMIKALGEDDEYIMMNYYRVARLEIRSENYQGGYDAAMKAKEIYDKLQLDSKIEYAEICSILADATSKLVQTPEAKLQALDYLKISFDIYLQLGSIYACAARRDMGHIYEDMSDLQSALECFRYTLERYEKELDPDHKYLGTANEDVARILFSIGDEEQKDKAIGHMITALGIFEKGDEPIETLRILLGLANMYNELTQYESEIVCLENMIAFFRENPDYQDESTYANILHRAAVAHRNVYGYGESEKYIKEAIEVYLKVQEKETPEVVFAYFDMVRLYFEGERYEDAVEYGELTLDLVKKVFAADSLEVFNAMNQLELAYCKIEAYDEAVKMVLERVELVRNKEDRTDADLIVVYTHVAQIYKFKGDYRKQIEWLEMAIALEQTQDSARSTSMADLLFTMGEAYRLWGDECDDIDISIKAKDTLLRAADIYEECESLSNYSYSEIANWATCYLYVSNIYSQLKEYDEALTFVETAEILYKVNKDINNQVLCYNSYAMIYDDMNSQDKAIEYYNKALDILDEDDINRYIIYSNIARCYQNISDFEKMLQYMTKAYDITFGLLDENDAHRSNVYSNLGDAYLEVGDFGRAKECFDEALYIYQKREEESIMLSTRLTDMGYITLVNKEYEKSIEYNSRALALRQKIEGERSLLVAQSYSNLGLGYLYTDRLSEAREYMFKALEIRKSILGEEPSLELAVSYYAIGLLLTHEGSYDEAVEYLLNSITYYSKLLGEKHVHVARSLHFLGIAYKSAGDQDRGTSYLNAALAIRSQVLRENHPDLIATREALALK